MHARRRAHRRRTRLSSWLVASLRDVLGPEEFDDAFHDGEVRPPHELVSVLA